MLRAPELLVLLLLPGIVPSDLALLVGGVGILQPGWLVATQLDVVAEAADEVVPGGVVHEGGLVEDVLAVGGGGDELGAAGIWEQADDLLLRVLVKEGPGLVILEKSL